jgi:hypothetical protein
MWDFEHHWDQTEDETIMIDAFNDLELKEFYENKSLWKGCFGGMSIITHDYLSFINSKYDISKLLNYVLTRFNRMSFERVIACLLQINGTKGSLLGNIHKYCEFGLTFNYKQQYSHLPVIKVWTGR